MDLHLKGRRALVTVSTVAIGLAIATSLARDGARVIIAEAVAGTGITVNSVLPGPTKSAF